MLVLNDGRKKLYQWDTGRIATVSVDCDVVHFSNLNYGESVSVEVAEGKVNIPNKLLTKGSSLYCWAVVEDENGYFTKKEQIIEVVKRPKPSDYVYTETEVVTIETAVKNALEEAKESGDFKGDKGDKGDAGQDYVLTDADKADIAEQAAQLVTPGTSIDVTAEVGQTIVVKSVDENGKPTEWEAADSWETKWDYEKEIVLDEAIAEVVIDTFDDGSALALKAVEVISVTKNLTASSVYVIILPDLDLVYSGGRIHHDTSGGYTSADKYVHIWGRANIVDGQPRAEFAEQTNITHYTNYYAGIHGNCVAYRPAITFSNGANNIHPNKATKFTEIHVGVPAGAIEAGSTIRIRGVRV